MKKFIQGDKKLVHENFQIFLKEYLHKKRVTPRSGIARHNNVR